MDLDGGVDGAEGESIRNVCPPIVHWGQVGLSGVKAGDCVAGKEGRGLPSAGGPDGEDTDEDEGLDGLVCRVEEVMAGPEGSREAEFSWKTAEVRLGRCPETVAEP